MHCSLFLLLCVILIVLFVTIHPGPSTSNADFLDPPQSTSTPKKPNRKKSNDKQRSQSVASEDDHKYTTLKSAKKAEAKEAAKKPIEKPAAPDSSEDDDDEGYEIVDEGDEDACEQPEAKVVVSETDSREDLAIPMVNEEPGQFWHVTVPPGKRHLIQVLIGTPRASLSWKFTTEKKVGRSTRLAVL